MKRGSSSPYPLSRSVPPRHKPLQSFINPCVSVGAVPVLLYFLSSLLTILFLLLTILSVPRKYTHSQTSVLKYMGSFQSVKIHPVVNYPCKTFNVACNLQVSFMLPYPSQFPLKSVGVRQGFQGNHVKLDKMLICEGLA